MIRALRGVTLRNLLPNISCKFKNNFVYHSRKSIVWNPKTDELICSRCLKNPTLASDVNRLDLFEINFINDGVYSGSVSQTFNKKHIWSSSRDI
jgi:hypothetical protein